MVEIIIERALQNFLSEYYLTSLFVNFVIVEV